MTLCLVFLEKTFKANIFSLSSKTHSGKGNVSVIDFLSLTTNRN